jgi:hypothetical protein
MTIRTAAPTQRAGVLVVRLGTATAYRAEFQPLKDKQNDPPPRHESRDLADDSNLEAYLGPFMPFISAQGSVKDLVARIKKEKSVTMHLCCSPMWKPK